MNYKKILMWVSLLGLTGIANFANMTTSSVPTVSPFSFEISNNNLDVKIDKEGGLIHSIEMKKWKKPGEKTGAILLNEPKNYKSCMELGFQGQGFPDRTTNWVLVEKSADKIVLQSEKTTHTLIRTIVLDKDVIRITDKISGYLGLAQAYSCINGDGYNGQFFIKTDEKHEQLMNLHHSPGLFNLFKKFNVKKIEISKSKDVFGLKTDNNFIIAVRPLTQNGTIQFFADTFSVRTFNVSTVGNEHTTEIVCLPNINSNLKEYGLENIRYYGWLSWISKPLSLGFEYIMGATAHKTISFVLSIMIFSICFLPFLWFQLKRKKEAKNLEIKLMKEAGPNFSPQMLVLKMFKFHITTILVTFLANIISIYYFLKITLGDCFFLKYTSFLWIKDLGAPEAGSIFNLYGLLGFSVPNFLAHFGVLKLWFLLCFFTFRIDMQSDMPGAQQNTQNNKLLMFVFGFFILNMYSSTGQMLGFCLFLGTKDLLIRAITKLMNRKKSGLDYEQL